MRRVSLTLFVLAGALALDGSAWGQLLGDSTAAGVVIGPSGQPDGLFSSIAVPGIGRGGPSVLLYFPSTGASSFTPSPLDYSIAGVQVPVTGTAGSVYLTGATAPGPIVGGGGLGLPAPRPPVRPSSSPAPARPAATKKAAADLAKAAPRAVAAPKDEAPAARSTLRERRGIR